MLCSLRLAGRLWLTGRQRLRLHVARRRRQRRRHCRSVAARGYLAQLPRARCKGGGRGVGAKRAENECGRWQAGSLAATNAIWQPLKHTCQPARAAGSPDEAQARRGHRDPLAGGLAGPRQ